jgi:hypothetical protein
MPNSVPAADDNLKMSGETSSSRVNRVVPTRVGISEELSYSRRFHLAVAKTGMVCIPYLLGIEYSVGDYPADEPTIHPVHRSPAPRSTRHVYHVYHRAPPLLVGHSRQRFSVRTFQVPPPLPGLIDRPFRRVQQNGRLWWGARDPELRIQVPGCGRSHQVVRKNERKRTERSEGAVGVQRVVRKRNV